MTYIHSIMIATAFSLCIIAAVAADDAGSVGAESVDAETAGQVQEVQVFRDVPLYWIEDLPEGASANGHLQRREGRMVETTIDLPPAPSNQRDARRILATVQVMPSLVETEGGFRAGDPWPRLGSVSVLAPDAMGNMVDVEIMRFITGFGGTATYTEDLTALAPLLYGRTTVRLLINTFTDPGWEASLSLRYEEGGAGFRRPVLALPVFNSLGVTAEENRLHTRITIPEGVSRPRLRIVSTGHATDGRGGDEFVSRTHILRIDGREIARWRPWAEQGNSLRQLNPASGRTEIDGREIWSSDFDRSGWHPGLLVEPLMIPAAELTPGEHEVELEILGIRPADPSDAADSSADVAPDSDDDEPEHGYWRVSVVIVADEPWPGRGGVRRGGAEGD